MITKPYSHRPKPTRGKPEPFLWVLVTLKDGRECEGRISSDLLKFDIKGPVKIMTRPLPGGQKLDELEFPRAQVESVDVIGVVGNGKEINGVLLALRATDGRQARSPRSTKIP